MTAAVGLSVGSTAPMPAAAPSAGPGDDGAVFAGVLQGAVTAQRDGRADTTGDEADEPAEPDGGEDAASPATPAPAIPPWLLLALRASAPVAGTGPAAVTSSDATSQPDPAIPATGALPLAGAGRTGATGTDLATAGATTTGAGTSFDDVARALGTVVPGPAPAGTAPAAGLRGPVAGTDQVGTPDPSEQLPRPGSGPLGGTVTAATSATTVAAPDGPSTGTGTTAGSGLPALDPTAAVLTGNPATPVPTGTGPAPVPIGDGAGTPTAGPPAPAAGPPAPAAVDGAARSASGGQQAGGEPSGQDGSPPGAVPPPGTGEPAGAPPADTSATSAPTTDITPPDTGTTDAATTAVGVPAAPPAPPATTAAASVTASPAPAGGDPPVAAQLTPQLLALGSSDGAHSVTVVLAPESLGEVRVQLTVTGDQVALSLSAGHEGGRAALADALPELRRELADAGLTLTDAHVSTGAGTDGQQPGRGWAQQAAPVSRWAQVPTGRATADEGTSTIGTTRPSGSAAGSAGVDIRV